PAEVGTGHRGKAEAQLLPRLTNPAPERTRRTGVIRCRMPRPPLGKHNLQSSNLDLTMKRPAYMGFGQTSAQESTAEAMTNRIQGVRERSTVPLTEQAARSTSARSDASLWTAVNQGGYDCNGIRKVGREALTVEIRRPYNRVLLCPRCSAQLEARPRARGARYPFSAQTTSTVGAGNDGV